MAQTSFNILYGGGSSLRELQCQAIRRAGTASSLLINDSRECLLLSTFPSAPGGRISSFPVAAEMVSGTAVPGGQQRRGEWQRWAFVSGVQEGVPVMTSDVSLGPGQIGLVTCGSLGDLEADTPKTFIEARSCW